MPLQLDVFLLILRLLFIVLLYLFLMQVVIAITRDLKVTAANAAVENKAPTARGHLVVIGGSNMFQPGTNFDLEPETTIGRGPINTIQIPEESVSGVHTQLRYHNGIWYVLDANSRNGTFVNNQRLEPGKPLVVRPGDVVQVGFVRFKLTQ
ncbi:MAG TPA: FHA domain-containing protein [Ktedonobacteraceae bacterium]|nr:FHA domain-containing protein [Ktedonobacteraceae bacterium]